MVEYARKNRWQVFWNRGNWWKALLLVVGYWGVYQLIGLGTSTLFHSFVDRQNPLSSPTSIFFTVALPIIIAGGLLLLFAVSLGWVRDPFGRQPLPGRPWMWLAVVLVLIPVVVRLVAANWAAYSIATVLTLLFLGLCIGFTEELLTRGFVVKMLRDGGHGEKTVLVLSSAYFATLHAGNALGGQTTQTVLVTVAYTFGFGAMMYLSLRVTGRIFWAILLHAATDPTTMLATGGIDTHSSTGSTSQGLLSVAGLFDFVYIALALVALLLVKNREGRAAEAPLEATSAREPAEQ
ncbi:CPBP family intramembrane metalloprotease [Leucobacter muris]|uniref:CPBP family intramembrane metalloprotease n=1 Tax=Leucobacter muris TaxID=1935379 RepID=A0ABX5QEU2_9MICO|nr:CPBP family intramembrane glutamic endopeptidase [Leucobacter muris]QAB17570.1 CPBP family intramembrane metalloprotease [Leucobacter muris]